MKTKQKRSFWDRLMTAVKAQDEEAVKAELESKDEEAAAEEKKEASAKDEAEGGDLAASLARIEALLTKLCSVDDEAPDDKKDDEGKQGEAKSEDDDGDDEEMTGDEVLEAETAESNQQAVGKVLSGIGAALTGDALKQIVARAEILAPGIAIPTGDALKAKGTVEKVQRKALETAYATTDGKQAIDIFLNGRQIKQLTGDALASVFAGAAELTRTQNNQRGVRNGVTTKDFGRSTNVADLNARNREFWAKRTAR